MPVEAAAETAEPEGSSGDARVDGADGLVRLCEAMRDESSLTFSGGAAEQARAYEAHAQRRRAALAGRYVAVIPATGYQFRHYEPGEQKLPLATNRSLILADGAELFVSNQDRAPGFALDAERAERILAQREAGRVGLRLRFRPVKSGLRRDVCISQNGGRMLKLPVDVVGMALVGPDGGVLARADDGERAGTSPGTPVSSPKEAGAESHATPVPSPPVVSAGTSRHVDASLGTPVRSPRVIVADAHTAKGRNVPASLAEAFQVLGERARPCYERVLTTRPTLRGTLVLAIRIGADEQVTSSRVEVSSLADDALTGCVADAALKATILGTRAGQGFSVPLEFGSAED